MAYSAASAKRLAADKLSISRHRCEFLSARKTRRGVVPARGTPVCAAVGIKEATPGAPAGCCTAGLQGLSTHGLNGLETGCFSVASALPVNYQIEEIVGLFDLDNETLLRGIVPNSFPAQLEAHAEPGSAVRRFIIIDEVVDRIYGGALRTYLAHHGVTSKILTLPTSEPNKSFDLVFKIAEQLDAFGLNRRKEPIIAIGGGVCLDVCGLAANLFRRNTPVIKIPTTVMAAVDASVGIKTAVNFSGKKNKMGTYCPPLAVFLDTAFLRTLPQRHLSNGAAEILKMACIKDAQLFALLEQHSADLLASNFQSAIASTVMRRSIQGMLEELEYNLWEHILVRLVDYGHTFSPAIEMAAISGDTAVLLHGEAVNCDMALTTQLAYQRGMLTLAERERVFKVMSHLGLALWHDVCDDHDMLWQGLEDTTKARDGFQRTPLMSGIGAAAFVNDLTREEVVAAAGYVSVRNAAQQQIINSIVPISPKTPAHVPGKLSGFNLGRMVAIGAAQS